jgi:hypothetical protein
MSADFLTTLAARTLGLTPVIQPAIASIFAPQSAEEGRGQMADGRREDGFNMDNTTSSPTLREAAIASTSTSSPLVPSGNSSEAISRLPYSQILPAALDTELGKQEQVNKLLSSSTNYQPASLQSNLETGVIPPQPLPNSLISGQQNQQIENPINSEVNNATERLTSSQIVDSEIKPVISQSLPPAGSRLQTEQNAISNDKTHSIYAQPVDLSNNIPQPVQQPSLTAPTFPTAHLQAIPPIVETLSSNVNLQPNIDTQNTPENPDLVLPISSKQSNLIPSPTTQGIVQRQIDTSTPLPSQSLTSPTLPLNRSESATPRIEPLINQVNSQQQEFSNTNDLQSESTTSPPSLVNANAVTPVISPLETQQNFASPNSANPTASPPSIVNANALTPVVSPLENQQNFASPNSANPTASLPSIVNANAVAPVVSPLENQQTFTSPNSANPTASPPSIVNANAVTPIVSPLETQQTFASPNSANPIASPPSIVNTNAVTPIVSPLGNQQTFASPNSANPAASPPSIVNTNAVTPIVSPLENQQTFTSPNSANPAALPPSIVNTNAVTPIVSPLGNQQTFTSPRQDNLGKFAPAVAASEFAEVTPTPSHIPVQTSLAVPITNTLEPQNPANSGFSRQSQENQAVLTPTAVTPLVDRRILKGDNSFPDWEFQARLPSRNYTHQNPAKVQPLVVMSQQRSLDLENETQLNNGRETSAVLPPTVQVTIGRIEVRSSPAPTAPKANNKSTPRQPSVSLQDYLKQRQGGKP